MLLRSHNNARELNLLSAVLLLVYLGANLFLVRTVYVHHDEGWYLYASQLVYRGELPYLDFAYFQTPLLPYVYGLFQHLTGPGILTGRFTSLVFSLALAALTTSVARRLGGNLAGIIALLCLVTSADFLRVGSYANNVILSTFLAMLGTWWLSGDLSKRSTQCLSAGCWSLAVLARLSQLPALALVTGFIVWHHRRHLTDAWLAIVTPVAILLAGVGIFAARSFDQVYFNLVVAQLGRRHQFGSPIVSTTAVPRLEILLGNSLLYASALLIILILGSVFLWHRFGLHPRGSHVGMRSDHQILLIGALFPIILLPNLLPGDVYPTYLALSHPFACILSGWLATRLYQQKRLPAPILMGIVALSIGITALMSWLYLPIIASWQSPGLEQIEAVSSYVESITEADDQLLTFETILPVNTGRAATEGTAMSYFSYFPGLPTDEAAQYHVVNEEILSNQLIRREAESVLITDFDIHLIRNPSNPSRVEPTALNQAQIFELFPELDGRYYLARTVDNYGEWKNHLYVFRRGLAGGD